MADYFTYCSFIIALPAAQQDLAIAELGRYDGDDRHPGVILREAR